MTAFIHGKRVNRELPINLHDALQYLDELKLCPGVTQQNMLEFQGSLFYKEQVFDTTLGKVSKCLFLLQTR